LFETAGFDLYTSNMTPVPSYQPMSPYSPSSPTVLTLASSVNLSPTITLDRKASIQNLNELPKSHSFSGSEVCILESDLACVGLSNELGVDQWGLKIVKLVALPELIPSSKSFMYSPSYSLEDEEEDKNISYSPPSTPFGLDLDSETPQTLPSIDTSLPRRRARKSPSSPSVLEVPFFTFTRTQEGSSLTADVKTLAALFQPEDRHLLVCCSSLEFRSSMSESEDVDEFISGTDQLPTPEEGLNIGELKCLQIDLRKFGLGMFLSV